MPSCTAPVAVEPSPVQGDAMLFPSEFKAERATSHDGYEVTDMADRRQNSLAQGRQYASLYHR